MTQDPEHHYSYDAEGNLVEVDGGATAAYTYGPMNQRVEIAEPSAEMGYLYNLAGRWASSWDLQGRETWETWGQPGRFLIHCEPGHG